MSNKNFLVIFASCILTPLLILMLLRFINNNSEPFSVKELYHYIANFEFLKHTNDAINNISTLVGYIDSLPNTFDWSTTLEVLESIGNIIIQGFKGIIGVFRDLIDFFGFIFGVFDFILTV